MNARKSSRTAFVREPVQVYLSADDSDPLRCLTDTTGLARAEILRRGLRSFVATQEGPSPMLQFLADRAVEDWPEGIAADHDAVLAGRAWTVAKEAPVTTAFSRHLGLVRGADTVSFEVMRAHRIRRVLTLDDHFRVARFETLP